MNLIKSCFSLIVLVIIINSCKKDNNDGVTITANKYAWVVGNKDTTGYGTILFTPDGGATFTRQGVGQSSLLDIDLRDVWAISDNNIWAVGTANTILHTTDGGKNWLKINPPVNDTTCELYSICISNSTIYISGSNNNIYKSVNSGSTWTSCNTTGFNNPLLQGIWAINPSRVLTVGSDNGTQMRGFIRISNDGGDNWDSLTLADDFNRHEWISAASSGNTIVIYGVKNYYVFSTDNGQTWHNDSVQIVGAGGAADINHLIMLSPQTWWAALDNGHIIRTDDAGAHWTDPNTGLGVAFMLGIDNYDSNSAISVGETNLFPRTGPITRTTDGGKTWTKTYTHGNALSKVSFVKQ